MDVPKFKDGIVYFRNSGAKGLISSGIIKEGGIRVNIIPEQAVVQLAVRAPTDKDVAVLKEKIAACFHAAATATGCQVTNEPPCEKMVYVLVEHSSFLLPLAPRECGIS